MVLIAVVMAAAAVVAGSGLVLAHGRWRQDITLYEDGRPLVRLPAGLAEPRPDLPYSNS